MKKELTIRKISSKTIGATTKCALMLAVLMLFGCNFPFEEDFEGSWPSIDATPDSGWGVSESHEGWLTFEGNLHLDNNISGGEQEAGVDDLTQSRAYMTEHVDIPDNADKPSLSFWYKLELLHEDDAIFVDLHYIPEDSEDEQVITIKTYTTADNSNGFFKWESISLDPYLGAEVWVEFRQAIGETGPGRIFTVDFFRIDDQYETDSDGDGIPDFYDPTPSGEVPQQVSNFTITNFAENSVEFSWDDVGDNPNIIGFFVYRKKEGEDTETILNGGQMIDKDQTTFADTEVENGALYHYRITAVDLEGHESEAFTVVSTVVLFERGDYPLTEDFENENPRMMVSVNSGWGITEEHQQWTTYSGTKHIDNNTSGAVQLGDEESKKVLRAYTTEWITVPEDATSPTLSYWYKLGLIKNDDVVYVDIHYIKTKANGRKLYRVDHIRKYKRENNTSPGHAWEQLSLEKYKGNEIWVVFRNKINQDAAGRVFTIDNLNIDNLPTENIDGDNIPDNFDPTPNGEQLSKVEGFTAESAEDQLGVNLSWNQIEEEPNLIGYYIYRKLLGSDEAEERLTTTLEKYEGLEKSAEKAEMELFPADQITFTDTSVRNAATYQYRIEAVSIENKTSESSEIVTVPVAYNLIQFPLLEDFEKLTTIFSLTSGSWAVGESHSDWVTFGGSGHLDNNPDEDVVPPPSAPPGEPGEDNSQVEMLQHTYLPENATNPALSFWYKSNFSHGDKVDIAIHYIDYDDNGEPIDKSQKLISIVKELNTGDFYVWKSLSLEEYKGKEVWITIDQDYGDEDYPRLFVLDDLRISDLSSNDIDSDGIPDECDPSPNGELLPAPTTLTSSYADGTTYIKLQWNPIENEETLLGYYVFRKKSGEEEQLINVDGLVMSGQDIYIDNKIRNAIDYTYRVAGVTKDGVVGEKSNETTNHIAFNLLSYPFTETFDGQEINIKPVTDMGWGVVAAHGEWTSFSGEKHLDNNPTGADQEKEKGHNSIRATMEKRVHIPADAVNPVLSYWYKANLIQGSDEINIDLSYINHEKELEEKVKTEKNLRKFKKEDNTSEYKWEQISLSEYKGTEVWVSFRQKISKTDVGRVFVIDDLRISENSGVDTDSDGIPDEFDPTPYNGEQVPPVVTIAGENPRSIDASQIILNGTATDNLAGVAKIYAVSDQYGNQQFGGIYSQGDVFSVELPLKLGDNIIKVYAEDRAGNIGFSEIVVTRIIGVIPFITINNPIDNSIVETDKVDLNGTLRTTTPQDSVAVSIGDITTDITQISDNTYSFEFKDLALEPGLNQIVVKAVVPLGESYEKVEVAYHTGISDAEGPEVDYGSSFVNNYTSDSSYQISATFNTDQGVSQVTVNGNIVDLYSSGDGFNYAIDVEGSEEDDIFVQIDVTDNNGNTTTDTFVIHRDTEAPSLSITSPTLSASPHVNTVIETPLLIEGTVTDKNLTGLTINGQSIGVVQEGEEGNYRFSVSVPLAVGQETALNIQAWDLAGNITEEEYLVAIDDNAAIEVITPSEGATYSGTGDKIDFELLVRVIGAQADDMLLVQVDDEQEYQFEIKSGIVRETISCDNLDKDRELAISLIDSNENELSKTTTEFKTVNLDNIELNVELIVPESGSKYIAPNQPIKVHFNKPIDPNKLTIEVKETVHALNYDLESLKGKDITSYGQVQMKEVHKDNESVPGGISHLPNNMMSVFYPSQLFNYSAQIFVTVIYDGQELKRTTFKVRDLPTFISSGVLDQYGLPAAGIEVYIPAIGRTVKTDNSGMYQIGFGDKAEDIIPQGRYKVIVNPGMKNSSYGITESWINVKAGRLNRFGAITVPALSKRIPFRRINSGSSEEILVDGNLKLDLSDAALHFSNGKDYGDVHVQFTEWGQVPHGALKNTAPTWVYSVQPAGIEVEGKIGIDIAMPKFYDSYDYIPEDGFLLLMVGYDPRSKLVVPVGVAEVQNKRVISIGKVNMQSLNYFGYIFVLDEHQQLLQDYVDGKATLDSIINTITN